MDALVYRFDNTEAFRLLEEATTARGPIKFELRESATEPNLQIAFDRCGDDSREIEAAVALPPRALDGRPDRLILEVLGDASGCRLALESGDAQEGGFAYFFGPIDFAGRGTVSADARHPAEYWGGRNENDTPEVVPPLRFFRLSIVLSAQCHGVDVGLHALRVTGDVRLGPPGIATGFNTD